MADVLYIHDRSIHNIKAAASFCPYLFQLVKPASAIDIGCGIGTWLNVLKKNGVAEVLGVDGDYVDRSLLEINDQEFISHDLRQPLRLNRKYDLAICLEVAEHLPEESSDTLIDTLTFHSDTILFSAALPLQGGQNHVNEQSFMYWVQKFNCRGYVVQDCFRNVTWENDNIDPWYRQNMFLVQRADHIEQKQILDFYHPVLYKELRKGLDFYEKRNMELQSRYDDLVAGKTSVWFAFKIFIKSIIKVFSA